MTEIDRLIEEGLTRYGRGDLDAAIEAWERALAIDPSNTQASSYVDYVRMNYELLVEGQGTPVPADDGAPFVGEHDYRVEIAPGELIQAPIAVPVYDALDEGWGLDDESGPSVASPRTISADPPQITLELEADEPPEGVSFDDATREYYKGRPPTRDLLRARSNSSPGDDAVSEFAQDIATPPFGSPTDLQTPGGFGQQLTGIRKRDLGFVKPAAPPAEPVAATQQSKTIPGMTPISPIEPARAKRPSVVPELKMTLRTPEIPPDDGEVTIDRGMRGNHLDLPDEQAIREANARDDLLQLDLLTSMPAKARTTSSIERAIADAEPMITMESEPEPVPPVQEQQPDADDDDTGFGSDVETKDLPATAMRAVALELGAAGRAEDATRSSTRELPQPARRPAASTTPPLVSQPTRDLGIRPPQRLPTEEESTGQHEVPKQPVVAREAPGGRASRPTQPPEVAPTDLVDTTTQLILDAVDRDAPPDEPRDDRTRRRIQGLLERASQWVTSGQADKAVAAIDLALAEDSTSPLAQKLIHRNQGAIMGVFQTYLGDLQRQPTLARPLHELATAPIGPRAAFLLSRIDGMLSLDEILDVSGMPRLEAYRYLCQLFLRGILK